MEKLDNTGSSEGKGQSLVEFALSLPVLVLLLMGIFDLGFAVYYNNTLSLAAREGARIGIINPSNDAIRQRVKGEAQGMALTDSQISISYPPAGRDHGSPITVSVTYNWTPITPLIGNFNLVLHGTSSMMVECKGGSEC